MAYVPIPRYWLSWSLSLFCWGRYVTYLGTGFSDFMARSHMAVMPPQLPDLISAAGHSQEPPTATTLGSASHAAALASPMPPGGARDVGIGPAAGTKIGVEGNPDAMLSRAVQCA